MSDDGPSYAFAANNSFMSDNVDRWIRGTNSPTTTTGVQGSRYRFDNGSVISNNSFTWSRLGYMLALMLPLANLNSTGAGWRNTPSILLQALETLGTKLLRGALRLHTSVRRFAEDQFARELFATAMDVVLVVYAMGFLVISMYQAAFFGTAL